MDPLEDAPASARQRPRTGQRRRRMSSTPAMGRMTRAKRCLPPTASWPMLAAPLAVVPLQRVLAVNVGLGREQASKVIRLLRQNRWQGDHE